MRFEAGGALPTRPDFDMLKAGLTAAQATTPTALASAKARLGADRGDALVRLFGEAMQDAMQRDAALRGSFNPIVPGAGPDSTKG